VHDVVWNACVDLDGKGSSLSKGQIKNLTDLLDTSDLNRLTPLTGYQYF